MSDVRLSNASPTVERVDARPPESVRPGARRSLFGAPDPEEIRRFWDASQRESVRDFRELYDYDPVTDTPLPGGVYDWEVDEKAPEFYSRLPHGSRPPRGEARDSPDRGEQSRTRTESAPETNGSRKRRSGASGSCFDECPKKRSKSDRDDDDDDDEEEEEEGGVGGVVKTSSRPEDNQEVLLNAGSCFDECPKKRSKSDRDDDDEEEEEGGGVGGVVKTSSKPEDNQEVLLNAEH